MEQELSLELVIPLALLGETTALAALLSVAIAGITQMALSVWPKRHRLLRPPPFLEEQLATGKLNFVGRLLKTRGAL